MDRDDPTYWVLEGEEHALVADQVAKGTPRVFAVCELERDEDSGELVEGSIVGWGMAFTDLAEVISPDGCMRVSSGSVSGAVRIFAYGAEVGIVWPEPHAA